MYCTADGGPLHQRNVLRALYRAQERARKPDGSPTFPELFEQDGRGELIVNAKGRYVLNEIPHKQLNLPHFHSLRHGAAMDCDDAEEARDLLRHKNTNVTNQVYRPHFSERRREALRDKLNARQGGASVATAEHGGPQQSSATAPIFQMPTQPRVSQPEPSTPALATASACPTPEG